MKNRTPRWRMRAPLAHAIAALVFLAAGAGPLASAHAQGVPWPFLPHANSFAFWPSQPDDAHGVTLELSSPFPFECGRVVDAFVLDSEHVTLTLRPEPPCQDSLPRPGYIQQFWLGMRPVGMQQVHVRVRVEWPDQPATEEEGTIPYEVVHWVEPPPPPGSDTLDSHILWARAVPEAPTISDPITIVAHGRFPYDCGEVVDARVVDSTLVMTLRPGAACTDSARTWEQSFELGLRPQGSHFLMLEVTIEGAGSHTLDQMGIRFDVTDPDNPPPPPPPPIDSLRAGMSIARPNPFREESRFSVSLDRAVSAEVAVFDLNGRRIATIHRGALPGGTSELKWDGRHSDGRWAASGIYFYRLTLPDRIVSRRVVFLNRP